MRRTRTVPDRRATSAARDLWSCAIACALITASATAFADDPPAPATDETIVIVDHTGEAARDRDRALGDAPFVTIVHPDEHAAAASVADGLATTAGVQARSLGGPGAFESVSVRGSASGQTEVLIDGVPLSRLAAVTTDLGRFALDSFGEVELYRGAVPVELGGAGVGGAVNLITQLGPDDRGDTLRASLGGGSFGARHLRAHYGDRHGRWRSSLTLGYQGATGDFSYFSNNNTPLNPHDDTTATRGNDAFDQVDASARLGRDDRAFAGGVRVAYKDQGLPGSVAQPSATASMSTLDAIADSRAEQHHQGAVTRELGYVLVEQQRLRDPDGELGLGAQARRTRTVSAGTSASITSASGAAALELRADRFRDDDVDAEVASRQPGVTGTRAGGAAAVSRDLVLAPDLVITAAMRFDALRTSPSALTVGPMALVPVPARWDLVPSPRLAVRARVARDVAIKGSAGYYVRLPTLVELFGDRGFLLGTPDLHPEHGPSADLGAVWAPATQPASCLGFDRVFVEADAFATQPRDTIAFITTAGYVSRAANIGRTESYGAEVVVAGRLARTISLTASYTRADTAQLSDDVSVAGKPVPRTPADQLYARVEAARVIAGHGASLWLDARYQSTSFLDPASLGEVPARVIAGAGVRVQLGERLALSLDVANLANVRVVDLPLVPPPSPTLTSTPSPVTDVAGFPLPGRSLYVTLHWSHR